MAVSLFPAARDHFENRQTPDVSFFSIRTVVIKTEDLTVGLEAE